ncbi:formyltetrahydrofolate deformylase 1, mitochondrial [Lactuca sativa]|uniref:formyltetrahydrofolate deformylase 1, mitochondrial n=1 Tax=Lactuca sativa TaxID=4236 RepID=UPI0022AEE42C|nr:formyltetrahydrofolate deformylase 1, mitochondrial [Lactuca sativa]
MDELDRRTSQLKMQNYKLRTATVELNDLKSEKEVIQSSTANVHSILLHLLEAHDPIITITIKRHLADKLRPALDILSHIEGVPVTVWTIDSLQRCATDEPSILWYEPVMSFGLDNSKDAQFDMSITRKAFIIHYFSSTAAIPSPDPKNNNHDRVGNTHVMRFLERHEIPYHYLSTSKEKNVEDEILGLVEDTDFLVLARYMQVLSGNFLKRYGMDVINIHHGLLPSFKGGNPSRQAFEAGVKLIGATTHFVTEELDGGPIIEQMVERVSHKDNLPSFIQKSENLEKQCLMKAIKSYCELRVLPYQHNRTVVF